MREWPLVGRARERRRLLEALRAGKSGAAIVGDAGVGKTRLAAEIVRSLGLEGRPHRWVAGSPASRDIPYAPFAGLLADRATASSSEMELHGRLLRTFAEAASDTGPILLAIDDVSELDSRSVSLVEQACRAGVASILLTLRAEHAARSPLLGLWKDEVIDRVDLEPLDAADARLLAEAILEGPIDSLTMNELRRRSGGNPLYLRELLLGGMESGTIVRDDHRWRGTGDAPPSARLTEVVRERLGRLDPAAERVVDALAVGGSLDLTVLERDHGSDAIEDLERRGLVVVTEDGNRADARLAHPLYAEVVLSEMPRSRRRRVMATLADALAATGVRRRDDRLRLALWRLDSGGKADRDLLLDAALDALATFDARLAERLARAAAGQRADCRSDLVLGRALTTQQRVDEARTHLERAAEAAASDAEVAEVALARGDLLYFRAGLPDEAARVLVDAIDRIDDAAWRDELHALLVLFRAGAGELRGVAESGRRIVDRPGARPRTVVHTLVFSSIANVMLGRFADASAQVEIGLKLVPEVRSELPLSGEMLAINGVMASAYAGDLARALDVGGAGRAAAVHGGAGDVVAMWSMNLAECLLLAGRIGEALDTMLGALAAAREADPFGVRGIDAAVAAICAVWLGRDDLAGCLHREIVDERLAVDVRSRIWLDRAEAWLASRTEGPQPAAHRLVDGARRAIADTHLVWAAWQLHDAVRLGYPELARSLLRSLADRIEGVMVPAMAAHAEALAAEDGIELERVASAFEQMGSFLFAAEAAAQAQQAYHARNRPQLAGVAAARASVLAKQCGDVVTPALQQIAPVALTAREQEIAQLASEGRTSRAIADRLGISVRTVDNHLGTVYGKLGIRGRPELSSVLGVRAPSDSENRKSSGR